MTNNRQIGAVANKEALAESVRWLAKIPPEPRRKVGEKATKPGKSTR